MMAPLRKGDLFPPPYVAPLGGPRQGPPAAQCRLKNWTARSCLRAAARVANVPRFRLRPVRGSFFLEYRRYFPDSSFLIIACLLSDAPSGRAGQLSKEHSPMRPLAEASVGVDVPGPLEHHEAAAPGPREERRASERRERIIAARHHDARERKAHERNGAEVAHLVGSVGGRVHVGRGHEQGALHAAL